MNFKEYQEKSRETAAYKNVGNNYVYPCLGLAGETGEVCEKIKKLQRDHDDVLTDDYKQAVCSELGDCLWYMSQICSELNIDLEDVAANNLTKLASRKQRNVIKGNGDER